MPLKKSNELKSEEANVEGHILHIIGQLTRGGAERQLSYLARALKKRGWKQSVVSLSHDGAWKDFLLANNIPVYEIDRNPFKPYRMWLLYRLVKRERPRVIIAWSIHAGIYAHWLVGIGNPLQVCAVRGDLTRDSNTAHLKDLAWGRRALEKADYVVSNSAWGLTALKEAGLNISLSSVISNIVFASGRADVSKQVQMPRIVAVGALKPLKGFDILLRALNILSVDGFGFELLIAGKGSERSNLERMIRELGLTNQVRLLGEIDDIPGLLAGSHMFVHPSRSEGLSNAILDAMAEGLPVVATAVGGTPEIIQDAENGLLVPPDEPISLARAIQTLLQDSQLRYRLGQSALNWVTQTCVEDKITDAYEQIFSLPYCKSPIVKR